MLLRLRFQSGVEFRRNVLESDRRHVSSVMDPKWMSNCPKHGGHEHKQFQFIAVILLAFPLSLAFVPVCHAQSEDSSRSDDTADSGADEVDTGSGAANIDRSGLEIFQAAGPNPVPPQTDQSIQSTVDAFRAKLGEPNNGNNPGPISGGRREINWDGGGNNSAPGPNDGRRDIVMMDYFIYGEP
jgi:hypothetical protein